MNFFVFVCKATLVRRISRNPCHLHGASNCYGLGWSPRDLLQQARICQTCPRGPAVGSRERHSRACSCTCSRTLKENYGETLRLLAAKEESFLRQCSSRWIPVLRQSQTRFRTSQGSLPRRSLSVTCPSITLKKGFFTLFHYCCSSFSFTLMTEPVLYVCIFFSSHVNESSILRENVDAHVKVCPSRKQLQALQTQPFYQKGINSGENRGGELVGITSEGDERSLEIPNISSSEKRDAIYNMGTSRFCHLIRKIRDVHASVSSNIRNSYMNPDVCDRQLKQHVERNLPSDEKHVSQQASIVWNMEAFGLLKKQAYMDDLELDQHICDEESTQYENSGSAVVEFGAGRGYLTHVLADYYGIKKVFLVERKSYKLKADRTLRQKKGMMVQRLRIDIEDLNLSAVEPLMGVPYLAIGKHLCGPAIDLTLRCCLSEQCNRNKVGGLSVHCKLEGLALATCCHHLCQWKHYINKRYMLNLGISKDEFHAMTWFTSWAVDADHGSHLSEVVSQGLRMDTIEKAENTGGVPAEVEEIMRNLETVDRAVLGLMSKEIIDIGRLMWVADQGLDAQLVRYVPADVSPENCLLVAKCRNH